MKFNKQICKMNFWEKIFRMETKKEQPLEKIRITIDNIKQWTKFESLLNEGKVKFDSTGRLRYLHGAPVGDLVLTKIKKDDTPIYKESAGEWFDPESQAAKDFIWP